MNDFYIHPPANGMPPTGKICAPALVVLYVAVVGVVCPVRYPPAVVGHHDERMGQVT